MRRWFTDNLLLKAIALLLTLVLYLFVQGDDQQVKGFFVPLVAELPEGHILVSELPDKVRFTVQGRASALSAFEGQAHPPLKMRLGSKHETTLELTPGMLDLPTGLTVTAIQPPSVTARVEPLATRRVQVTPRVTGRPREGFETLSHTISPTWVEVSGPESRVSEVTITPDAVDLTDRAESFEAVVELHGPPGASVTLHPTQATVSVEVQAVSSERSFADVPVQVHNTGYKATVEPPRLTITLRGPRRRIQDLVPEALAPVIDARDEDLKPPGTYRKRVVVNNLPPGVEVVQISPPDVTLTTLTRAEPQPHQPPQLPQ
jgi:YbbR domain-containing protein